MVELQTQACYDILNLYAVWMMAYLELIYERRIRDERQISDTTCGKIRKQGNAVHFSPDMKFKNMEKTLDCISRDRSMKLGLAYYTGEIDELKAHKDDINYEDAKRREKEVRHDVMSHVYAYGLQCPKAKGIIHLGATSCYVGDNTDIIIMTEGLKLVRKKLVNVIDELSKFADKYKAQPTLAFHTFSASTANYSW